MLTGLLGCVNDCHHCVGHSLGHDPCGVSRVHVEGTGNDHHDVESDDALGDVQAHDQNRSAKKQKEEYEPTDVRSVHMSKVWNRSTYLDLEKVVPTDTLVVHLVIRIICIPTTFILDKSKSSSSVNYIRGDLRRGQERRLLTDETEQSVEQECRSERDDHSYN